MPQLRTPSVSLTNNGTPPPSPSRPLKSRSPSGASVSSVAGDGGGKVKGESGFWGRGTAAGSGGESGEGGISAGGTGERDELREVCCSVRTSPVPWVGSKLCTAVFVGVARCSGVCLACAEHLRILSRTDHYFPPIGQFRVLTFAAALSFVLPIFSLPTERDYSSRCASFSDLLSAVFLTS